MCAELLSEYDSFLAKHLLKYGGKGKGSTSYISRTTCEEVVTLMAEAVKDAIIQEVKLAKYFSLIIDSMPDISHTDQLTVVIRYVLENGEPVERFLQFIPNTGHKASEMEKAVVKAILKNDLFSNGLKT